MGKFILSVLLFITGLSVDAQARGNNHGPYEQGVGRVCFYEHAGYQGASFCLGHNEQREDLNAVGFNDRISSILVEGNISVQVFEHNYFQGRATTISSSVYNLKNFGGGWNDAISSLRVGRYTQSNYPQPQPVPNNFGTACFYENENFRGASFCLKPGDQLPALYLINFDNKISSISLDGGVLVEIFTEPQFFGDRVTVYSSAPSLRFYGPHWNDQVSSIIVRRR